MKRWSCILLALVCALAMVLPSAALAASDYTYTSSGGGVTITKYKGSDSYLDIPSQLGGKPVTKIGDWAFRDCTTLRSVTVPQGVTRIERNAFWQCSNLENIDLPSSLTYISFNAFSWCISLESVTIPDSVGTLGRYAFSGCSALQSIHLPDGLKDMHGGIFSGCSALSYIEIPNGVRTICEDTFANCSSLRTVVLSSNVRKIENGAFRKCTDVTIVAPAGSFAAKQAGNLGFETAETAIGKPAAEQSWVIGTEPAPYPGQTTEEDRYPIVTDTTITGYVFENDYQNNTLWICDDSEMSYGSIHWDRDTELEGLTAKTGIGTLVQATLKKAKSRNGGTEDIASKITVLQAAQLMTVTGKLEEIHTGSVCFKNNKTDYWLLDSSECVNWTENYYGKTAIIEYFMSNGQALITKITMK